MDLDYTQAGLKVKAVSGADLEPYVDALGGLRIAVFREFPYLYEGTLEYERSYLRTYVRAGKSRVVLAFSDGQLIGATTCLPLVDEAVAFREPFERAGIPVETVCYFGESIVLPHYRGKGLGKFFFQHREAHARRLTGIRTAAFCAVDRAANHPLRPAAYRPLDAFWNGRGYTRRPELRASFDWVERGGSLPTQNTLTFWTKAL